MRRGFCITASNPFLSLKSSKSRFKTRTTNHIVLCTCLPAGRHRKSYIMHPTPTTITAADGYPLQASVFVPGQPNGRTVVVGSAMGVLQQYYYNFSEYLRGQGFHVVVFDYRGVGLSAPKRMKGFEAHLHQWGELDIEAALQYALHQLPTDTLLYMSHSVGGQVFGLAESNKHVQKVLMVASQSGYWNLWEGYHKVRMFNISHLAIPSLTAMVGYLPAKKLGLFEDVPKGVANQWASWIRHPEYLFRESRPSLANFQNVTAPLRMISFSDDHFAPPQTVDNLATRYPNAAIERINYTPEQFGLKEVGHFNYFKRKYAEWFWEDALEWLIS
ncbi:alpha/beta fold hydrolase [soil metagenome]